MEVYNSSRTAAELEYALGAVPSIGENGNWFIGEQDTGIFAKGINVTGAEVGQTVKISAVDENGVPTAWEPADNLAGAFTRLARITNTEDVLGLAVEGLNMKNGVLSGRVFNVASTGGTTTGCTIKVNGISRTEFRGGIGSTDVNISKARFWIWRAAGHIYGKVEMSSGYIGNFDFGEISDPITSVEITSPYINASNLILAGAIFELYEGVFPNVP